MDLPVIVHAEAVLWSRSSEAGFTSILDPQAQVTAQNLKKFYADPAKVKAAVTLLKAKGFSVYSVGKTSISIGAPPEIYEKAFPGIKLVAVDIGKDASGRRLPGAIQAVKVGGNADVTNSSNNTKVGGQIQGSTVFDAQGSDFQSDLAGLILAQPQSLSADTPPASPSQGDTSFISKDAPNTNNSRVVKISDLRNELGGGNLDPNKHNGEDVHIIMIDTGCYLDHPHLFTDYLGDLEWELNSELKPGEISPGLQTALQKLSILAGKQAEVSVGKAANSWMIVDQENDARYLVLSKALSTAQVLQVYQSNVKVAILSEYQDQIKNLIKKALEDLEKSLKPNAIIDIVQDKTFIEVLKRGIQAQGEPNDAITDIRECFNKYKIGLLEFDPTDASSTQVTVQQMQRNGKDIFNIYEGELQSYQVRPFKGQLAIFDSSKKIDEDIEKVSITRENFRFFRNTQQDLNGHGTIMVASALAIAPKARITVYKNFSSMIFPIVPNGLETFYNAHAVIWRSLVEKIGKPNRKTVVSASYSTTTPIRNLIGESERTTETEAISRLVLVAERSELAKLVPILSAAGNEGYKEKVDTNKNTIMHRRCVLEPLDKSVIAVGGAFKQGTSIMASTAATAMDSAQIGLVPNEKYGLKQYIPDICAWCANSDRKTLLTPVQPQARAIDLNNWAGTGWGVLNGGTSSATAQVAGVCALILQITNQMGSEDMLKLLKQSTESVLEGTFADEVNPSDVFFPPFVNIESIIKKIIEGQQKKSDDTPPIVEKVKENQEEKSETTSAIKKSDFGLDMDTFNTYSTNTGSNGTGSS